MDKRKRILILTDDMPWGHRALAQAAYAYLKKEKDFEVELEQIKLDSGRINYAWGLTVKLMPKVIKYGQKIFEGKTISKLVGELGALEAPKIKKVVDRVKPDLVLSSHFMLTHALVKIRKDGEKFSLLNCVSDPWTVFPMVFNTKADKNLVYDQRTVRLGLKAGIEKEKMEIIGWLTRPEFFEKKIDLTRIRKKYSLRSGILTVFVGGGSLGATAYLKLFPALTLTKDRVQVVFNCGTDRTLKTIVEKYAEILSKKNKGVKIKIFGWVDRMDELLAVSDIVLGKAGPNFLFDTVACGKPFVSITHVPAQEAGNVEMIRKKKIGWVKEGVGELTNFFIDFLKRPEKYVNRFKKNIEKEAEYNHRSGERLVGLIKRELALQKTRQV